MIEVTFNHFGKDDQRIVKQFKADQYTVDAMNPNIVRLMSGGEAVAVFSIDAVVCIEVKSE